MPKRLSLDKRKRRQERDSGPSASSPVTCVSHAFRASLYEKNEAPKEEADFKGCERNNMMKHGAIVARVHEKGCSH